MTNLSPAHLRALAQLKQINHKIIAITVVAIIYTGLNIAWLMPKFGASGLYLKCISNVGAAAENYCYWSWYFIPNAWLFLPLVLLAYFGSEYWQKRWVLVGYLKGLDGDSG